MQYKQIRSLYPYKLACEMETSQAEIAEKILDDEGTILPIVPNDESSSVPTVFWVVNFNTVVEQVEGGGSANTTHMMAFQEMTPETKTNDSKVQIQRTKRRKSVGNEFKSTHANINPKRNPPSLGLSGGGFKDNSNTYPNISCGYYFEKFMELTSLIQAMIKSFRTSLIRFSFVYSCVINTY